MRDLRDLSAELATRPRDSMRAGLFRIRGIPNAVACESGAYSAGRAFWIVATRIRRVNRLQDTGATLLVVDERRACLTDTGPGDTFSW